MKRSATYNTKQREAIFSYIVSLEGAHVTAAQIVGHFEEESIPIGRTTIYRHLDKLTETGKLRKYTTDGLSGACYQHTKNSENCRSHLHFKCEECGELQHIDCKALDELQHHFFYKHGFNLNPLKTVLYGKCRNCP